MALLDIVYEGGDPWGSTETVPDIADAAIKDIVFRSTEYNVVKVPYVAPASSQETVIITIS